MNYSDAIKAVTEKRRRVLDQAAALKERLLDENKDFYENEAALRKSAITVARGEKTDVKALEKKRAQILKSLSLTKNDLDPPPVCAKCGDTGYSGGRVCSCVVRYALENGKFSGLAMRKKEDFDLSLFDEKYKDRMEKLWGRVNKYIDLFPLKGVENLVFLGSPGSGKTFTASIIEGELFRRGFTVASMTAFSFLQTVLSYHTAPNEDKAQYLSPILDCDLLIIDDLGTESILKKVTLEYLYLVLNERMCGGKHTLITTNLSPDMLAARYGERIASRLFDKRLSVAIPFPSKDVRTNVKK